MREFEFTDHISRLAADLPTGGIEGIGDDCAVMPLGEEALVYTADLVCEGVHFLRHATSAREIGAKSLAVNLSDIAAMGARPVATLLSIAMPTDIDSKWAAEFIDGYTALAARHGVALIGGDTTRSESGVVVNVTAIGRAPMANLKRRSAARAGDIVMVGGELGASGAGLRDILNGRMDTPLAAAHRNPSAQVEEGIWLGTRSEVHAMMDLSDGLASDIRHILRLSGVGADIDISSIPVAAGSDHATAACGGEDYKLLFTVDAASAETLMADFRTRFGTPPYPVGRITPAAGVLRWLCDGEPQELDWKGFEHK